MTFSFEQPESRSPLDAGRPTPPRHRLSNRSLSADSARAIISASFPDVDTSRLQYFGAGWEFDTFLTRDGWVFRFPRRIQARNVFDAEIRLHTLLERVLPPGMRVPRVERLAKPTPEFPCPFAGRRLIPGIPSNAAEPRVFPMIAGQIAAALGALHATPEEEARAVGVRELDAAVGQQQWIARGLARAAELRGIDPIVDAALNVLDETTAAIATLDSPPRLIHNDLSPEHLLVDPSSGSLQGILDWTDAALGDAVRDFVFLVTWRGWPFADEVLRSYPLAIDAGFRQRLRAMARLHSIAWLANAREEGADVARHLRAVHNVYGPVDAP